MTGRCSVTSPCRTREIAGHPLNHAYQVIPKQRVALRCQRSATSISSAERIKKNGWPRQRRARGSLQSVCVQPESLRKNLSKESLHCTCCNALFSPSNLPESFIVLIPVKHDPDNFDVQTHGACSECSKNDNKWIFDNGPKRASSSVH